jgi:ABC-type multidrug transport system fused ATPase/permease subunit
MIEKGEIIEEGTHNQLCQENGKYKSLYQKQLIEE